MTESTEVQAFEEDAGEGATEENEVQDLAVNEEETHVPTENQPQDSVPAATNEGNGEYTDNNMNETGVHLKSSEGTPHPNPTSSGKMKLKSNELVEKTSEEKSSSQTDDQKPKKPVVCEWEHLGRGIKKTSTVTVKLCKDPKGILVTKDSHYVVLDVGSNKIYVFDSLGSEVRHFQYLYNYQYQGGFCLLGDETLLISLRNEKYSSVCFYNCDGKFKFSAFLEHPADIPSIAVNSRREIVTVDSRAKSLCVINEEKSVDKTTKVKDSEKSGLQSVAVSSHDDIYILEESTMRLVIFDEHLEHKKSVSLEGSFSEQLNMDKPQVTSSETVRHQAVIGRYKLLVAQYDSLLLLDRTQNSLDLFSCDGKFGYTIVNYSDCGAQMQDVCLDREGFVAVLVTGQGSANASEVIVYRYSVPGKLRGPKKKAKGQGDQRSSQCCTLL